jgi:predicted translin family RNA/ssDNA-binding protein
MTVKELIEQLNKLPQDYYVYYESGDYKDDYQEVNYVEVSHFSTLGTPRGVYFK